MAEPDPFAQLAAQMAPTYDYQAQMPTPGYFTGRIEHLLDKLELEARQLDAQGKTAEGSMTVYAIQAGIQANFQMANLSVNYFTAFANCLPPTEAAPQA